MAEEKKKGKGKLIIIIVVALLLLGGGVFAGVYYGMSKANAEEAPIVEAYTELGQLLVNLSDEGSKKYVQMTSRSVNTNTGTVFSAKFRINSAPNALSAISTSTSTANRPPARQRSGVPQCAQRVENTGSRAITARYGSCVPQCGQAGRRKNPRARRSGSCITQSYSGRDSCGFLPRARLTA